MRKYFSLLTANTGYTIPGTSNTDVYGTDIAPALIVGLTVALVLILSVSAAITVIIAWLQVVAIVCDNTINLLQP